MHRRIVEQSEPIQSDNEHGNCQKYLYSETQVLATQPLAMRPDRCGTRPGLSFKQLEYHLIVVGHRLNRQLRKDSDGDQNDPLHLVAFCEPSLLVFGGSVLHTLGSVNDTKLVLSNTTVLDDVIADKYRAMIEAFPKSKGVLEHFYHSSDWVAYSKLRTTDAKSIWVLGQCHKWTLAIASGESPVFKKSYNAIKVSPSCS